MADPQTESAEGNCPPRALASDEFYRALAAAPRRRVLFALLENEQSTVSELAEFLYGWAVTADEQASYQRLRTKLYHCHLPTLAAAGLIEFDSDGGHVERTDLLTDVAHVIHRSIEASHARPQDL